MQESVSKVKIQLPNYLNKNSSKEPVKIAKNIKKQQSDPISESEPSVSET